MFLALLSNSLGTQISFWTQMAVCSHMSTAYATLISFFLKKIITSILPATQMDLNPLCSKKVSSLPIPFVLYGHVSAQAASLKKCNYRCYSNIFFLPGILFQSHLSGFCWPSCWGETENWGESLFVFEFLMRRGKRAFNFFLESVHFQTSWVNHSQIQSCRDCFSSLHAVNCFHQ